MKHLVLLISLLAVPLSSIAMVETMSPIAIRRTQGVTRWEHTLDTILQAFKTGTLTQQKVNQDVLNAPRKDEEVYLQKALDNEAAITSTARAIIRKGAAATDKERENVKAGLLFLKNGLGGFDIGEVNHLEESLR